MAHASKGEGGAAMDRRRWLRGILPAAARVVTSELERRLERRLPPQRRPPGAAAEPLFLSVCTRCGDCVEACRHRAVHTFAADAGVHAGTPVMLPDETACAMCDGFPCAAACKTGALTRPEAPVWRLGTARVDPTRCITYKGPECGACAGLCPPSANALALRRCRPEIDEELCVGCGLCITACPTVPPAIELLPWA